jgi:Cytochrome c554 and c-prime
VIGHVRVTPAQRISIMRRNCAFACLLLVVFWIFFSSGSLVVAQTVSDTRPELTTAQPHPSLWWPNQGSEPRSAYTGPGACARCHRAIWESWQKSQMAHAMEPASDSEYVRANPDMSFEHGNYTYRLIHEGDQSIYSVTDGSHTLSIPLLWAYGVGVVGQTFMFSLNSTYYETEIAYYPVLHRPSIVAGLPSGIPPTLPEAFGLPLAPLAARQCISCHTTAAVTSNELHVDTMIPGVSCEACHGPGAQHVAQMAKARNSKVVRSLIFNPATLDPVNLESFCGECHRTSQLVVREGLHGLDTVHYEPYRLEMSQCWIMTRRITCVTCHNPHQALQHDPAAYDSACLGCHYSNSMRRARLHRIEPQPGAAGHSAPDLTVASAVGSVCPVSDRNCVTCHMPKCRLPRAPFAMSDHFIRIVGPDDACSRANGD